MLHYLETNSLRRLIPYLDHKKFKENIFTSIYALMEIFSGIEDEKSYRMRKSILDKIIKSNIPIWLNLPETLLYKAFGFKLNDNEIVTGIGRVMKSLTTSESLNGFIQTSEKSPDNMYYEFLINYDKYASTSFGFSFLKSINTARINPGFKNLRESFNLRWSSKDDSFANEYYKLLIKKLAQSLWENKANILEGDDRTLDEIENSYDHTIDIQLMISTLYSQRHVSSGSIPGRNDYFDLNHLAYLDSTKKKIVTDDKIFHKLLVGSFSKLIISTDDFIKKNSI